MITQEELITLWSDNIYSYGKMVSFVSEKYNVNGEGVSFWHWGLDYILGDIMNGSVVDINWKMVLDNAIQYDSKEKTDYPEKFIPICEAFYKEFGDRFYKVYVSW